MTWYIDGDSAPGWFDYVGLLITIGGFALAVCKIRAARKATTKATNALQAAQHNLSRMSLVAVIPQFHAVANDLSHVVPAHDSEGTQRALLRFVMTVGEVRGLLSSFDEDHSDLSQRLGKASDRAKRVKGDLASIASPDVVTLTKHARSDIDKIAEELTQLASTMRNTIDGGKDV
jgi:methyl-accepting chemotaxis protein